MIPFGLTVETPWALVLLVLIPLWWIARARLRPPSITFSRAGALARGPRAGAAITRIALLLRNLVLLGAILALARPRSRGHAENVTSEGINIVLVIDLSSSMLAEDFQPANRIQVAKATVKQFIAGPAVRPHRSRRVRRRRRSLRSRSRPTTTCSCRPSTTSRPASSRTARRSAPRSRPPRTDLRDAPGKSRVMILLTDGVNNRGDIDPRTAAQAAASVRHQDLFDRRRHRRRRAGSRGARAVWSSLREPAGRDRRGAAHEHLADDGRRSTSARATPRRCAASTTASTRSSATPVQSTTYVRYTELFRWPLGVAVLALLLELGARCGAGADPVTRFVEWLWALPLVVRASARGTRASPHRAQVARAAPRAARTRAR